MKKRQPARVSFLSSVRVRLTLWYLAIIAFILFLFGGSLYATQTFLSPDVAESKLETQLYQDTQHLRDTYKQALLQKSALSSLRFSLSQNEVVLLLRPDHTVLDVRGTLPADSIQQLQERADSNQALFDITISQSQHSANWRGGGSTYRFLATPLLEHDARVATLMVGQAKAYPVQLLSIWLFHAAMGLLVAAIGGYWLAGKALQPVKMITRTANEINATDLRRRLHLRRKDEFGELAATFDQMLARLEAAFKRQNQFAADASHELRTPLTIINLEINQALTQSTHLQNPENYRDTLERIQAENEQMTTIVNSLLLLARADTGQFTLHKEEVDLSDIALASVERLLSLAQQHHVSLATGELPELLIEGDAQHLSRMLMNLVENAIKYTSGVGKHVCVELTAEKSWGIIRIQDDGPGIADNHLPYLFDRFYRVDKARTRRQGEAQPEDIQPGGTGLGLSIAQWIAHSHGGEIRVQSTIGAGSLFEVRLPLKETGESGRFPCVC
ncbi:two-component sensor histidine kinase [Ktedonobacter sp. SOSP1-85]|uniref:sensor histidine kinase n=1 Tax=Ktedonobacter sp. SOSP1-85 TaxID=2778367 RepID=UPI001916396E|nr:HAMP domain-containing sensor histidine kinase [Ktedonobacter sp. SOSP1-85]GHO78592.1 two-component sensor histidine kinase [Ktedonobacter sp. SOSP1-85]